MLPTHPPSARVQRQRRDGLGGLGELERGISSLSCWRWWLLCEHFGTAVSSRCVYVSRACEEDSFSPGGGGARTRHILSQKIAHLSISILQCCLHALRLYAVSVSRVKRVTLSFDSRLVSLHRGRARLSCACQPTRWRHHARSFPRHILWKSLLLGATTPMPRW